MHKCKKCQYDEDNKLQLIVKENNYLKFNLKEDGSLEFYDSDADQNIYLQCPACGTMYEFKNNNYDFSILVEERHIATRIDYGSHLLENPIVNLNDYEIKKIK